MIKSQKIFYKAQFLLASPDLGGLSSDSGAEVAFSGRSNSGKSSVINTLVKRKSLAKTSSIPGKTRHITLFKLDESAQFRLADLPGYGYAKIKRKEQQIWGKRMTQYILERQSLKGVVLIMDVRHPLSEKDKQMLGLLQERNLPAHMLLNKIDKLRPSQRAHVLKKIKETLLSSFPHLRSTSFSALKGEGVKELQGILVDWLGLR